MSAFPATKSPIVVDPNGNIMLIVTSDSVNAGEITRFQVSSHILCLVSPVFLAMLGATSRFKEATELVASLGNKGSMPVEVKLEDDDPNVLWEIHHKSDRVPTRLTFQELFTMAVVIDKYDCREALRMWLEHCWLPEWRLHNGGFAAKPETEWPKWLFMSYVFAEREIFKQVTKRLILEGKMRSAESDDFVVEGSIDWQFCVPQGVISEIIRVKKRTVALCVDAANIYEKQLQGIDHPRCQAGVPKVYRQICDSVIYGQWIHEYTQLGLWGCDITNKFDTSSANEVQSNLKSISMKYFMGDGYRNCCCKMKDIEPLLLWGCKNCSDNYRPGCVDCQAVIKHRGTCDFTNSLKATIDDSINAVVGLEYDSSVGKEQ